MIPTPKKERRYHLVVLAKNAVGYRNLVKLTSISHLRGMRGRGIFSRACIDKPTLERHSEGLIVATACLGGEIPQAILKDRPDVARDVARWYQGVFGDDFYLEIQDHGSPEDRIVNVEMARISKELGIPLIATNDAHYLTRNDVEAHDALLCVLTGKLVTDEKRLRYTGTEYIKSEAQMLRLFADHLEPEVVADAVANTAKVAEKVEDYDILGRYQMPRFPIPEGHTPVSYLREVSEQGCGSGWSCRRVPLRFHLWRPAGLRAAGDGADGLPHLLPGGMGLHPLRPREWDSGGPRARLGGGFAGGLCPGDHQHRSRHEWSAV